MAQPNNTGLGQGIVDAVGGALSGLGSRTGGDSFRRGAQFAQGREDRAERRRQTGVEEGRQVIQDQRAAETHETRMWDAAQRQLSNSINLSATGYRNNGLSKLQNFNQNPAIQAGAARPLNERQALQADQMAQYSKQMGGLDNWIGLMGESLTNQNPRARQLAETQAGPLGKYLGFETKLDPNGRTLINAPNLGWVEATYENAPKIKGAYKEKMDGIMAQRLSDKASLGDTNAGLRNWAGQNLGLLEGLSADQNMALSQEYEQRVNSTPVGQRAATVSHAINSLANGKKMGEIEYAQTAQVFKDYDISWQPKADESGYLVDIASLREAINRGNPEGTQIQMFEGKDGLAEVTPDLLRQIRDDSGITDIWEDVRDRGQNATILNREAAQAQSRQGLAKAAQEGQELALKQGIKADAETVANDKRELALIKAGRLEGISPARIGEVYGVTTDEMDYADRVFFSRLNVPFSTADGSRADKDWKALQDGDNKKTISKSIKDQDEGIAEFLEQRKGNKDLSKKLTPKQLDSRRSAYYKEIFGNPSKRKANQASISQDALNAEILKLAGKTAGGLEDEAEQAKKKESKPKFNSIGGSPAGISAGFNAIR